MESDEEIKQLLREIRDQQKAYHEAWRTVWEKTRQERGKQQEVAERLAGQSKRSWWVWLAVIVVLVAIAFGFPSMLTSCARGLLGSYGDVRPHEEHEARAWLNQNKNEAPLASNRFECKAEALEFVEKLYESGAKKVYVTNIRYDKFEMKEYGGPYADSLIADLPRDEEKRAKLFMIYADEAIQDGYTPVRDRGQARLFFWWD